MLPNPVDLSIIIVNWNSKEYLRQCIASILATTHDIGFEIVVIDNASFDGCSEMLQKCYHQVHFIQSEKNLGFAKANNAAFRKSRGLHLLFLNPDTELIGPAVSIMLHHLQKLTYAGAIGCKLLNADETVQTSCVQSFPTILNQLLDSEPLRRRWPKANLWGMRALYRNDRTPQEVEAISGACIMLKRGTFEQIGKFSEEYFMYGEDIDLCYKARQAGYINYYVPEATVIHFGGGSTQKEPNESSVVLMRESVWRFLRKTRGEGYGLSYRISTLIAAMGRIVIMTIFLPLCIIRPARKHWNSPFRKWGAILSWSLGFTDRVRNQP